MLEWRGSGTTATEWQAASGGLCGQHGGLHAGDRRTFFVEVRRRFEAGLLAAPPAEACHTRAGFRSAVAASSLSDVVGSVCTSVVATCE